MTALLAACGVKPLHVTQDKDELVTAGRSVVPQLPEDILDDCLPLLFMKHSSTLSRRFTAVASKTPAFDIRGPFGIGLGVTRFASGDFVFVGQGSGTLPYVDFVDYLLRFYLHRYCAARMPGDKELLKTLDCRQDDFAFTFVNPVSFSFYFAFKSKRDFEALFLRDFKIISLLEAELKLGVLGKVVIRLPKSDSTYGTRFEGISFDTAKVDTRNFLPTLTALGLQESSSQKKVERVVLCGRKEFCREWMKGLETTEIASNKIMGL